jgi:hypothetical protein
MSRSAAVEHDGWGAAAPMHTARAFLAAVRGPNGTIYILGGSYHGSDAPVHQVDVFTIAKADAAH